MANISFPTVERLRQRLIYMPDTGDLFWKERPLSDFANRQRGKVWNIRWAGKPALTALTGGYRHGDVDNKKVRAHRVAWAIYYGNWPDQFIDHVNGDRSDNRIDNLRLATPAQNAVNRVGNLNSTSRFRGVSWNPLNKNWRAQIKRPDGGSPYIGSFLTEEEAAIAFNLEAVRLHGEFARLNILD